MRRDKHRRILWSLEPQFQMPWSSLPINLHLNDISNVKVLSQLFNTWIFLDNAWDANIQRAVHSILLVVLDECLNDSPVLDLSHILNMTIDKGITLAVRCVSHYFLKYCHFFIVLLPILVERMYKFESPELLLQLLVYHGQIAHILCRVVDHVLC